MMCSSLKHNTKVDICLQVKIKVVTKSSSNYYQYLRNCCELVQYSKYFLGYLMDPYGIVIYLEDNKM